ncbi:hypothetical protein SAMN05443665_104112 [Actinomadura meyerae]|uniref:Uncharacterized protein n=1 Tax=Actinomadura meyerae TaxID=240840 RepID=A0A239NHZ9_9ACTN|nr:hypothetical protein [Actinomadura meyerae]SNT53958.1 hypothetical protein SAMN05443665_104112 [Actinomadura meyerae]
MPAHGSARTGADQAAQVPATVNWALACIGVLLVGHVFAWLYPPQGLTDVFHLVWGVAYAWLALLLRRPRPWARAWLTGLLAVQFTGRFVVFAVNDDDVLLRTLVVIGWLVTLAVFILLWSPASNRYFASARA